MYTIRVSKYKLEPCRIRGGTRGSVGMEKLHFVFSKDWDGLLCKVAFYPPAGKMVEILYFGEDIDIPPEVTAHSGVARFVVSGYRMEGETTANRLLSLTGLIEVDATMTDCRGMYGIQSPTVYEQLRDKMRGEMRQAILDALSTDEYRGEKGDAATVTVGETETLPGTEPADVENVGTESNAILRFKIPRGLDGCS